MCLTRSLRAHLMRKGAEIDESHWFPNLVDKGGSSGTEGSLLSEPAVLDGSVSIVLEEKDFQINISVHPSEILIYAWVSIV